MHTIIIDEEFRALLPPLDSETYRLLEENLLEHGCLTPLVLWKGILIDGYNRYGICIKHDIPFNTVEKDLSSRDEALIWIISNQMSRRNLTPMQISHLRGLHYRADKKIQGSNNPYVQANGSEKGQNDPRGSTANHLARKYRVSPKTIKRDARVANAIEGIGEASPEAKRMILLGEVAINRNKLEALSSMPREDIEAVAMAIEEGTYDRRAAQSPPPTEIGGSVNSTHPDIMQLAPTLRNLTSDFDSMLRKLDDNSGITGIKAALRSFIDTLELLYLNME